MQEHTYHVLENSSRPPYGVRNETHSCADGRPETQLSDPPQPIHYDTICDERPIEERLYAQVPSSPLQSADDQSQDTGPIYQELPMFSNTGGPITAQTSPAIVKTITIV